MKSLSIPTACLLLVLASNPALAQRKQKAEAIKTAAMQFASQAQLALKSYQALSDSAITVSMGDPGAEQADLTTKFEALSPNDVVSSIRHVVLGPPTVVAPPIDRDIRKLEELYAAYGGMFNSLPQGAWFAKDAVGRSKSLTLRLTTQLSSMADKFESIANLDEPMGSETDIAVGIRAALKVTDKDKRDQLVAGYVKSLLTLRTQYHVNRDNMVTQLLAAAQSGLVVYKLTSNFDHISLGDILGEFQNLFGALAQSKNADISSWSKQIKDSLSQITASDESTSASGS